MSQHFMEDAGRKESVISLPLLAFAVGVFIAERIQYRHRYAKRLHWRQGILLAEIAILFIVGFMPENGIFRQRSWYLLHVLCRYRRSEKSEVIPMQVPCASEI